MIKNLFLKGRQRSIMLVSLLLLAVAAFAVPAKPGLTRLLTLINGTTVNATLVGDEHGHFWLGADGKCYQMVDNTDAFQEVNKQAILQRAEQRRTQANQRRSLRLAPRRANGSGAIIGQKKGLIILVNFSDKSFESSHNNALYQRIANEVNFSYGDFKGSMRDYFYAQSEGQFELTFDVVGPVTVSESYSYYGSNDSGGDDNHPAEMIIEALNLANPDVNFADYDWDGDGEVEQVYVVYAGKGEADGGASNTIWPHEWSLSNASFYGDGTGKQTLDGVKIDTYACGSELNGSGAIDGIGTMCHEFSHCLGYPDFYDTDYSGGQGMGYWDLMDGGSYNGDGYRPAGFTSYERWVAGWKTPIELLYNQSITNMKALQETGSEAYIIYNKGNNNEYFLLENRQQVGWDEDIPGEGLLILHVDYDAEVWANNKPNDIPSHQRMTWIAADNNYQYQMYNGDKYYTAEGMANDPFPYGSVNAFGKNTTPAAKLFNKNIDNTYYLDSSVENITQNADGTVSFDFVGISNVATPTFSPAAGRYDEAQTVTISCATEGTTIYYTLDDTKPSTASSVYSSPLTISETTTIKAIAVKDEEASAVATATFKIGASVSDPNTKTFKLVNSINDLEPGMRYIIACGSKNVAAGSLSSTSYLNAETVTKNDDVITITDNVAVFVLDGNNTSGWYFKNESSNQYLQCTSAKKLAYGDSEFAWKLEDEENAVIITTESYGTILYNVRTPRFNIYTSDPQANMILANLYVEYSDGTTPIGKQDVTMAFNPASATATLGQDFTEPTLTTNPADLTVVYSSSKPAIATVDANTGKVTLKAAGTTTITATFAGNDNYNAGSASYTLTVVSGTTSDDQDSTFTLVTDASEFVEGDYIIVYNNAAMNTTIASNRLQYTDVTPVDNVITTTDASIIWHIAPNGSYYTIYNAGENKFAASTGVKNQAQLMVSDADDKALWSVTTGSTFEFVNKHNADHSVNANLRRNGTYGFACYSASTGGALSLYKRVGGSTPVNPVANYYQPADGKQGAALKTAMSGVVYNHTEKSYDELWTAFLSTDLRSDGKIWDIYSSITNYEPQTKGSTYTQEGDCYNREHAFPQSWFGGNSPMKTDLHFVYPTDGYVNGRRSNNPYGETNGEIYQSANGFSKLGLCTYPGYTGKVFEPADEYKGDLARAIFYVVTCYEEQLPSWYTNNSESNMAIDGSTYPALTQWQLDMLMEWSQNDPVSEKEINRNNAIYAIQSNRNPFIDYPGLEEYIWGFMTTTTFSYDNYVQPVYRQNVDMAFNPASVTATLGDDFTEPTLTINPAGLAVTYSSSVPAVATVDESTGEVTLVATGTTVITATFAGNDSYKGNSASYTLTVREATSGDEETLLYEGLTAYESEGDNSNVLNTNSDYLDYSGWDIITKVYAGGTNNAHSNGGCLKFGSSKDAGSMTTRAIALTGDGTLTFYLKKYSNDTGKLTVTVDGAIADVTEFTPDSEWTLCTVNLTNAEGYVTITLGTTTKRAYVDEITLVGNSTTTGITTTNRTNITNGNGWYDLNGCRLQNEPTAKGIYLHNGRKVVIR